MMGFFFACVGFSVKTWYLDSVLVCSGTFISFSGCESHTLVPPMYFYLFWLRRCKFSPRNGFFLSSQPRTDRKKQSAFVYFLFVHPNTPIFNMVKLLHIYCVHFCARMLDHNPLRFLSQETFIGLQSLKYLWVKPFQTWEMMSNSGYVH